MKPTKSGLALGLGLLLTLAVASSAAAGDNHDKFGLGTDAVLEGVVLPAGKYVVEWQGSGPSVSVTIKKGSQVLVSADATVSELTTKTPQDSATVEPVAGGDRVLTAMRFGGKKLELKFAAAAAQKKAPASDRPLKSATRLR